MGRRLKESVLASEIAQMFGLRLLGNDRRIDRIDSIESGVSSSLCFAKNAQWAAVANGAGVVICASDNASVSGATYMLSPSPRLDFARILAWLDTNIGFSWSKEKPKIHPTARIGQHSYIGDGVQIGAQSVIGHNVVIGPEVVIGERCNVKSGAVIGEDGFGFERDLNGAAVRLPHLGTVRIANDVEIGSLTTVCRGTLADTIIYDGVKIDDHVHIAHNVKIGEHSFVIACAEVSGGVSIGQRVWIAPSSAVLNQLSIGDDATIGLGAVVLRNVEASMTVVGNPAKPLPRK